MDLTNEINNLNKTINYFKNESIQNEQTLKQKQKNIKDLITQCKKIKNDANIKYDQLLIEKNMAKENEEKIINYIMLKYSEKIGEMEKKLNEKINDFKEDIMSSI